MDTWVHGNKGSVHRDSTCEDADKTSQYYSRAEKVQRPGSYPRCARNDEGNPRYGQRQIEDKRHSINLVNKVYPVLPLRQWSRKNLPHHGCTKAAEKESES